MSTGNKKSDKKIPMEIVTLISDPIQGTRDLTRAQKMRRLIDYLKVYDADKNKEIKVLEHLFYGLKFYLPLVSNIKGGYLDLNLDELVEALNG